MADKKKENDWLQTLVDQNRNRSTIGHEQKPLLSETSEQKVGRLFYPNSTGAPAAERWAAAQKQKAAIEAQRALKASQQRAKDETAKSAFGKPSAPNFDSKVSPPGRPKPQFLRLEEPPKYPVQGHTSKFHEEYFTGPGSTQNNPVPPPVPIRDVIASPEMDDRITKHLQDQDFQQLILRGADESSWGFYDNNETRQIITGKETNDESICDGNSQACLHVHPKDKRFIDPDTGFHNGREPDDGHRNVFGNKDWRPVFQRDVPNYMIGPDGDLLVLEARNGKYVPRFVGKRFDIFNR